MNARYAARRRRDLIARALCVGAAGVGLAFLAMILFTLFSNGLAGLSWRVLVEMTPPPGASGGGLANAIVGSLLMTALGVGVGAPLGLLAGVYLAEYGRDGHLASVVGFVNDILLSAPSIIIGLFVYAVFVAPTGGFSALAGALALAMIVIPVVTRATRDMLSLTPNALREAAAALGMPRSRIILRVTAPAARAGIVTGLLIATARVAGETAPLLFTALSNQFWSLDMTGTMANLPVTINNFIQSPYERWKALAWTAALLITLAVLALNVVARVVSAGRPPR